MLDIYTVTALYIVEEQTMKVTVSLPEKARVLALIDLGAAESFINQEFVINNNIQTQELETPIIAYNINRIVNKHSKITYYLNTVLDFGNYKESVKLYVSDLRKQKIILGFFWLKELNFTISWNNSTIK